MAQLQNYAAEYYYYRLYCQSDILLWESRGSCHIFS